MSIGPKEAGQRAQREAKAIRQYRRAPYAFTKTVTPALYDDEPVTETPLPKPPRRAKVAKVNRGGRPKKANALTPAQKQRAYRERQKGKA